LLPQTVIVSDEAGQFKVGSHALRWVHAERLVHKLDNFTDDNRHAAHGFFHPVKSATVAIGVVCGSRRYSR
jgi:hypothetical protein